MAVSDNLGCILDQYIGDDKLAVLDRGRAFTYAKLLKDICAFSVGIANVTNPGDVVLINMFNSYQFAVSYFGTMRAGRVALLFNFKVPQAYKDYVYQDSKATITITHDNFGEFINGNIGKDYIADVEKTSPALMLYTSGSTSVPKGVVMPHDHKWFVKKKVSENKWLGSRSILIGGPLYHASGLRNLEIGLTGHAIVMTVPDFESATIANVITKHKPTTLAVVPTIISRIVNDPVVLAESNFDSIRTIIAAGAPVTETLYKQVAQYFPNAKLVNRYGITEIGPGLFHDHPDGIPDPLGSVGYPLPDIEYKLVDGVLHIKSPAMMLKYSNMPSANIVDGFYVTNDIFRKDEQGFYYYIGRADDMFTNGGNNIYPRTIEEVLESHPSVNEATVVGVDDEIKGAKPYAFVTLKSAVNIQELKDLVLSKLPATHCPKSIWIIDSLPLNTVNKIDRKALKLEAEERVKNESLG